MDKLPGKRSHAARTHEPSCIVIANNRETADGLHSYLNNSGVATRTSRHLRDASTLCANATALVLFPDDFDPSDVLASVRALRADHPRVLIVLVTSARRRLRVLCEPHARAPVPIVLPKPAFGWSVLDAIRTHQLELEPT